MSVWWCVWTCVCTWCSQAATQRPPHRSRPVRLCSHMFTEAPGPIHGHNGVYFQKEGTLKHPIAIFLPDSLSVFLSFQPYLSVSLSFLSFTSNNASSQFTSHLSLLCAHTLSSPSSHYVVSVRFVDGVICMKSGGQRRLAIFHIYWLVWYLGGQQKMAQKGNLSVSLWVTSEHPWCKYIILTTKSGMLLWLHSSY